MAQDKKSFILYTDLLHTIDLMPDENAGKLFKHILKYVNDLNPETDDLITKLSFEPIKQQLKRDLREWEKTIETKSDSGKLGNLKRWHLDLYLKVIDNQMNIDEAYVIANNRKTSHPDNLPSQPIPNIAVNVTESVNDNVNVNVKNIEERKLKFADTLKPFLNIYGKDLLNDFFKYWTEPNKSNTKFKQELEKTWSLERRLETWAKNDTKFKPKTKEIVLGSDINGINVDKITY